MKEILLLAFLALCITGILWVMWEVENAPEQEDEEGYAHPPKEDLK
jgi:hypothetical protein